MEYKVRNGYVLVEPIDIEQYNLLGSFRAGKIAFGPKEDLGVIVFFSNCEAFTDQYLLVENDDVLVWLKPDAPEVVAPVEVVAEPSNDQQSN